MLLGWNLEYSHYSIYSWYVLTILISLNLSLQLFTSQKSSSYNLNSPFHLSRLPFSPFDPFIFTHSQCLFDVVTHYPLLKNHFVLVWCGMAPVTCSQLHPVCGGYNASHWEPPRDFESNYARKWCRVGVEYWNSRQALGEDGEVEKKGWGWGRRGGRVEGL